MTKKAKEQPVSTETMAERHARVCAERMHQRVEDARRRAEEYELTLDPRDRAA